MVRWRGLVTAGLLLGGFFGCSGKATSTSPKSSTAAGMSSGASAGNGAEGGEAGTPSANAGSGGAGGSNASGTGGTPTNGGAAGSGFTAGSSGTAGSASGSGGAAALGGHGGMGSMPPPPPATWTCQAVKYADGKTCDCGCGAFDPDCKDATLGSCDECNVLGGCASGPCPSDIDPDDNSRCSLPTGWVCNASEYGDGVCDCGCGTHDVDCAGTKADACSVCPSGGCAQDSKCTGLDPNDNTLCTTPPTVWKCDKSLYRDGSHCDCGCGFWDPDCSDRTVGSCDTCNTTGSCSHNACPGAITATENDTCVTGMPPAGWTCSRSMYADGESCDCGCGVPDLDCGTTDPRECQTCACGHCPESVDANDPSKCAAAPAGWTCPAEDYATGECHCGCGVMDPACLPYDYCIVCEGCALGDCQFIDQNDITQCRFQVPSMWTCLNAAYGDDVCDCGCGAPDPACHDVTSSACQSCNTQGSCSTRPCDDPDVTINPTNNESCLN